MILYEDWRDLLRIFLCAKGEGIHIPLNEWSDRIGLLRKGGNQRCEYGKPARSVRNRGKGTVYKMQGRDEAARQQLIEGNLRLVLSIIKRFENRNENMDEFVSNWCGGAD